MLLRTVRKVLMVAWRMLIRPITDTLQQWGEIILTRLSFNSATVPIVSLDHLGTVLAERAAFSTDMRSRRFKRLHRPGLLYVCGTYAPGAFAGSEISAHELLRNLAHQIDVAVVTDQRYTGGRPGRAYYEGIPIFGFAHEGRREGIREAIDEFAPQAILTQLLWSDAAIAIAKEKEIPSILRIVSLWTNIDLALPSALIVNARFSQDWVRKTCGRHAHLVFSTVDIKRVLSRDPVENRRLITMFNPIDIKGGRIFHGIARAMPQHCFAVVPGWYSLRNKDGTWDRTVLRHSVESQRGYNMRWTPKDVDFSGLENVEILKPRAQVAEIYGQTRILLVPSQWEETLARVSIEALANGIPVIGSAVGGLKDNIAAAGILVEDKENIQAWVDAIQRLDNPDVYAQYSQTGLEFVRREYNDQKIAEDFINVFRRVREVEECS